MKAPTSASWHRAHHIGPTTDLIRQKQMRSGGRSLRAALVRRSFLGPDVGGPRQHVPGSSSRRWTRREGGLIVLGQALCPASPSLQDKTKRTVLSSPRRCGYPLVASRNWPRDGAAQMPSPSDGHLRDRRSPILGLGVETVTIDASIAARFKDRDNQRADRPEYRWPVAIEPPGGRCCWLVRCRVFARSALVVPRSLWCRVAGARIAALGQC